MTALTLAQIFEPALPDVPPAPFIETWLLGSGYRAAGVLAAGALVAWIALARAGRWRVIALAALSLLAIGALVLGRVVVTTREALRDRVRVLVDAAVRADEATLTPLLHPDARVRTRFGSGEGRDRVLSLTRQAAGVIQSHRVGTIEVDLRGPQVARTLLSLSITADSVPPLSQWIVDWQRPTPSDDWVVTQIEPIWVQGMTDPAGPRP